MTANKFAYFAAVIVLLGVPKVWGFDYPHYQAADLDEVVEQRRPKTGVDIRPVLPLKITAH
jgi:hypothetical protein